MKIEEKIKDLLCGVDKENFYLGIKLLKENNKHFYDFIIDSIPQISKVSIHYGGSSKDKKLEEMTNNLRILINKIEEIEDLEEKDFEML